VTGRVLVCDPLFSLDNVRELLPDVAVECPGRPLGGDDVVGLLTGPDNPISPADLDRLPALRVVDVDRVDADQRHSRSGEVLRGRAGDVRMFGVRIGVAPPVARPAGAEEHRLSRQVRVRRVGRHDAASGCGRGHDAAAQIREGFEGQP